MSAPLVATAAGLYGAMLLAALAGLGIGLAIGFAAFGRRCAGVHGLAAPEPDGAPVIIEHSPEQGWLI